MDKSEIDPEVHPRNPIFVFLKRRRAAIFGSLVTCIVLALLGIHSWDLNHIEQYQDAMFYISSFRFSASVDSKAPFNSTWNVAACQEMLEGYNYDPGSIRMTSVVSKTGADGSVSGQGSCDFKLNVTSVNDLAKVASVSSVRAVLQSYLASHPSLFGRNTTITRSSVVNRTNLQGVPTSNIYNWTDADYEKYNLTAADANIIILKRPQLVFTPWKAWLSLYFLTFMIISMVVEDGLEPDIAMIGCLGFLCGAGIISSKQLLSGFSNEGIATVGVLFVVAQAMAASGIVDLAGDKILGTPRTLRMALLRLSPVALHGFFITNTPMVTILIPVVLRWSRTINIPASKLLIPLSYMAILGGTMTVFGTSTNLVVASLALASDPDIKIGLFSITKVGAPTMVAGCLYVILFMPYILPVRESASSAFMKNARKYVVGAVVEPKSVLVGKTIEEAGLRRLQGLFLFEIQRASQWTIPALIFDHEKAEGASQVNMRTRAPLDSVPLDSVQQDVASSTIDLVPAEDGNSSDNVPATGTSVLAAPDPQTKIEQGDLLFFSGDTSTVNNLWQFPGLVPASEVDIDMFYSEHVPSERKTEQSNIPRLQPLKSLRNMNKSLKRSLTRTALLGLAQVPSKKYLVEVVIASRSILSGKTIRTFNFREVFGAAVLAIHRDGERVNQKLGDVVLQAGDNLLLEARGDKFMNDFGSDQHYFAVSTIVGESIRKPSYNYFVMILAFAILAAAFSIPTVYPDRWTFFMTALIGSYVYWGLGLISPKTARAAVPIDTMVMFASSIGLSFAMENSGLARAIAYNLLSVFAPAGNLSLMYGMYLCVAILNPFVSNQATVALMYPIAYQASRNSGLSIYAVIYMLMMAGSADFATPIGYITNLMVYSIGGYKFSDYLWLGLPMQVITCVLAVQICYAVY
eukprot:gb/GEZN01000897.1/.p1 GENE.gb/GEZN01000897.1/~~gb/GEZN01000897.1/.p1  ORF type:complete len:916 (+),score=73.04 gb/GEZN01000897.1/:223-2970(+)